MFVAQVVECLLHGLSNLILEPSRIKAEEFFIEGPGCCLFIHRKSLGKRVPLLIAVWNTDKTGPLVCDQADGASCEEERNYDDDNKMDGIRKQAASGPQRPDDRPTGNDPCRYWEQDETEGHDLTRQISHFRVRAVEQTIH